MISRIIPLFSSRGADGLPGPLSRLMEAASGPFGAQLVTQLDPITGRLASTFDASLGTAALPVDGRGALATVSIAYGYAPGGTTIINGVNAVSLAAAFNPAQVTGLATAANLRLFDGVNMVTGRTATDSADDQANLGNVLLAAMARLQGFDGATWDRLRTASAATLAAQSAGGALLSSHPGEWSLTVAPAANTTATATRAAGGAGVRHVLSSINASITAVAAIAAPLTVVVRDGASGVGTILWQERLTALAGTQDRVTISGLNLVGSANTAMTVEFTAVPGATNFETLAATGYSAS